MQSRLISSAVVTALCTLSTAWAAAAGVCESHSSGTPRTVVELYTSEGCSSCPPADKWLSTLKGRDDVIAMSFHVNYWDRLGWKDRFASAEATERQHLLQQPSGAKYVYTPQVIVDGHDWRGWPGALPAMPAAKAPRVSLQREGNDVVASVVAVSGPAGAGQRLAGYWAVLEDDVVSGVKSGENAGSTLHHDGVVRRYQPVAAWPADMPQRIALALPAATGGTMRRVVFVVTDARLEKPVQAVVLGC